jgi:PBSX family phage terminase large subunit
MGDIVIDIAYPRSEMNPEGAALPKQEIFHKSKKKFRMLEGGWGTGKTTAICLEASKDIAIPKNYILMGRMYLPEFKSTTLKEFLDIYEPAIENHNRQDSVIKFKNGTEIYYTGLDDSREAFHKIQSLNLGAAIIDQAEEISRNMFDAIKGRLRRKNSRRCFYAAANPNGHDWIWEDFFEMPFEMLAASLRLDNAEEICKELNSVHFSKLLDMYKEMGKKYKIDPEKIQSLHAKYQYHGIISTSLENPYLPNDTLQSYLNLPDKVKKRYVYCSFDDFTGNVYSDFSNDNIIPYYRPMIEEKKYIVLDYGYRNPTAVGFYSVDYDGVARMYDEIYRAETLVHDIALEIKAKNPDYKSAILLADPSIYNTQQNGRSIADDYMDEGLTFLRADNDVSQGINRVNQLFKDKKLFISQNCTNWFYERDRYKWKDLKPGQDRNQYEEPVKRNDHLMDQTRYFVNYIWSPIPLTEGQKKEIKLRKELDMIRRVEVDESLTWTTF